MTLSLTSLARCVTVAFAVVELFARVLVLFAARFFTLKVRIMVVVNAAHY